jgi:chromosome segregation ATPase
MNIQFKVVVEGVEVEASELLKLHNEKQTEFMALSKKIASWQESLKRLTDERKELERELIALNVTCRQLGLVKSEVQTRFRGDTLKKEDTFLIKTTLID